MFINVIRMLSIGKKSWGPMIGLGIFTNFALGILFSFMPLSCTLRLFLRNALNAKSVLRIPQGKSRIIDEKVIEKAYIIDKRP